MNKITRSKKVEGVRIPGIIHNNNYFFINLDVYEDGMVNCWELVDLDLLKQKIYQNWLVPSIPNGQNISIHGLGCYKIEKANWYYNNRSYFKFIFSVIKQLNPSMKNIYKITKEEIASNNKRHVGFCPNSTPFMVESEHFYQTEEGDGFSIFYRNGDFVYLSELIVYKNGVVKIFNTPDVIETNIDEIENLINSKLLLTTVKNGTWVIVNGFGKMLFSEELYSTKSKEKLKEINDIYTKLNGNETSLELCRMAYYEYLENPDEYYRNRLKELYEKIPEHERMYLGDMDSKDSDYRRIIYHPDKKREV